jgi:hypothetical protein
MTISLSDDGKVDTTPNGPKIDMGDPEPTRFDDVMIDIETMSLHPHRALILSVGLLEFNAADIDGLKIGSRSLLVLDLASQLSFGRVVDNSTQDWWSKQSDEASAHWLNSTVRYAPAEVIDLIRQWCHGRERIWANGTQFDLSNIIGLAEDVGVARDAMWHYQAPRDMRTFVKETNATRLVPIGDALDIPHTPHHPVHDCVVQAWQVWSHYQRD